MRAPLHLARSGRRALFALGALLVAAACDHGAWIRILDVRTSRAPDNRVVADVQLEAVEQGGGGVGPYCVSIHWFNFGFNSGTPELTSYQGELDSIEQCGNDLGDGDQRTYRLASNRTDFALNQPARVQVRQGRSFQTKDGVVAP